MDGLLAGASPAIPPLRVAAVGSAAFVARLRDAADADARAEVFRDWLASDAEGLCEHLLSELPRPALDLDRRIELVWAAETAPFPPALYEAAADALLAAARLLRVTDAEQTTWMAIRRASAFIPLERANEFVEFLTSSPGVDTRLATLQAVWSIFEPAPVERPEQFAPLADKCYALAAKHFDPDVFVAGEVSAIAIEATVVLAELRDARFDDVLEIAARNERSWIPDEMCDRLAAIAETWDRGAAASDTTAFLRQRMHQLGGAAT